MKKKVKKVPTKKPTNAKVTRVSKKPATVAASVSIVLPLGSRVLIKPFTKEELMQKNNFGIILPTADSKEKSEQGIVLAVGPGEYRDGKMVAPTVKVGDKVVFSKYGYEDITIHGEELFLIKEENILAILK